MRTIPLRTFLVALLPLVLLGCAESEDRTSDAYAAIAFHAADENDEISELLDRVREATGVSATSTLDLRLEGEAEFMGNPGRFVFAMNSDENAWFTSFDGPVRYVFGHDSHDYIMRFIDGTTRKAGPGETSRGRLSGYAISNAWLLEDAPFRWSLESDEDPDLLLHFELADSHGRGVIHIDRATHLPVRWVNRSWEGEEESRFVGSFDDQSPWVPEVIEHTDTGGATSQTRISAREANDRPVADQLRHLVVEDDDFFFDPDRQAVVDLRRSWRGHLMIQASVNDSEPAWFFLDSGAGVSVLDQRFVETLGVEAVGHLDVRGTGGLEPAAFHRVDRLSVGVLTIRDHLVSALDLSFLDQLFDEPVAGIIGSGVFARSIVEIDVEAGRVALHDPSAFEEGDVAWLPIVVDGGNPAVEGRLEGRDGWFVLDTGDGSGALGVHSQAVSELALLENRETREVRAGGVGGQLTVQRGRIGTLELGPFRHHDVEANFFEESESALANPYYLGTIGMRILREYRVIFDYANERMALVPTP